MGDVFAAVSDWLQYDREAIAQGELWRLVTCHLVHFGLEHLVWDTAVFALLAVLCWRLGRVRCLVSLGAATLAIPAVLFVLQPGLPTYRGLSGLDSALFVTAALGLGQSSGRTVEAPGGPRPSARSRCSSARWATSSRPARPSSWTPPAWASCRCRSPMPWAALLGCSPASATLALRLE